MKKGGICHQGDCFFGRLAGFLLVSLLLHAALFSLTMSPLRGSSQLGHNPEVLLLGTPGAGQPPRGTKDSENPASPKTPENSPTHPRASTPPPPRKERGPLKSNAKISQPVRKTGKLPTVTKATERSKKKPESVAREPEADEVSAEKKTPVPPARPEPSSSSFSTAPAKPEAKKSPGTSALPSTGPATESSRPSGVSVEKKRAVQGSAGSGPVSAAFGAGNGPRILQWVPPEYPLLARHLRKEGRVLLRLHIGSDGQVSKVEVVSSAGYGFDRAAVAAVRRSRFQPATRNGMPVACLALLPVEFKLRKGEE